MIPEKWLFAPFFNRPFFDDRMEKHSIEIDEHPPSGKPDPLYKQKETGSLPGLRRHKPKGKPVNLTIDADLQTAELDTFGG